jgi:hypothetical protein
MSKLDLPENMQKEMAYNSDGFTLQPQGEINLDRFGQINLLHDFKQGYFLETGKKITAAETAVLLCLWRHSKIRGFVIIGSQRAAHECGISKKTFLRAVNTLVERKLLLVRPQTKGTKRPERGQYVIRYRNIYVLSCAVSRCPE